MRTLLPILVCAVPLAAAPTLPPLGGGEPSLRVTLRVDGVDHVVDDGQEIALVVAGKEIRARATVHANRRFDAARVSI